jgi:conjugal transfer/type IV secretion protein DotA/TraY
MKFLNSFKIFFLCLALMGLTACSDDSGIFPNKTSSSSDVCGASSSNIVAPESFAICGKDMSYNILYMIFDESFNEYPFLNIFLDDTAVTKSTTDNASSVANPELASKAYAANIGGSVLAMLKGFTQVILFIAMVLHSYSVLSILFRTAMSGEFLQGMSKVWVVGRALLSIFLITPLGSLNLIQIMILALALAAIMIANFFMGVFLSKVQTDSMNADAETPEIMFGSAVSESASLVSASLCQIRTTQALRQARYSDVDSNISVDNQFDRLASCIMPDVKISYGKEKGTAVSASFGNSQVCGTTDANTVFDATKDGYGYQCGGLSFSIPDITITTTKGTDLNDSGAFGDSVSGVSLGSFTVGSAPLSKEAYDISQKVAKSANIQGAIDGYYKDALSAIQSGNTYDYTKANDVLTSTLQTSIQPLFDKVLGEYDYETAVQVVGNVYSNVYVKLMGAFSPTLLTSKEKFSSIRPNDFIWDLEKYSSKAAESLVISHCIHNLNNNYKGLQNQVSSLSGISGMSYTNFVRQKNPVFVGECSWITPANNTNVGANPKFVDDTAGPQIYSGRSNMSLTIGSGNSILEKIGQSSVSANSSDILQESDALAAKYLQQAQAYKLALATYFYSVKKGTQDSFANIIKDKKTDNTQVKMRQQGWASLGGYIMAISANQTNVKRMLQNTTKSASWSGYENGNNLYVNSDAFTATKQTSTLPDAFHFNIMFFSDYFGSGNNTNEIAQSVANNGKSTTSSDEAGAVTQILLLIENYLTNPLRYLKQAGGMPLDQPLRVGVEQCFQANTCFNGSMHPVNAVIYMGQDLIDISINLLILKAVSQIVMWMAGQLNAEGTIENASWIGKLISFGATVLKLLAKAASVINAILTVFLPFIFMLLILGIFFCYIVPLMPYMAFLILFVGWIVLIIEMMFAMPIWALMMSIPGPSGETRANLGLLWSYLGQIVVRPALMVIGTIIGWYFSIVSLYFVNMTLFGVLAPISEAGSGTINGLINIVMFYIAYMVIVFVALKHSFSIISTFPDKVSEVMDIKPNGDQQMTDRLQTDRLVHTIIASNVMNELKGMSREVSKTFSEKNKARYVDEKDKKNIQRLFDDVRNEHNGYSNTSGKLDNPNSPP